MSTADLFVSVTAALPEDPAHLGPFVRETLAVLAARYCNYELLLVGDGARPAVMAEAIRLAQAEGGVRLLRLSRCVSPDAAALAGLESAVGDYVVVLRADSDPPAEIARAVDLARQGADVVQGEALGLPRAGLVFRCCRAAFHTLGRRLIGFNPPSSASTLCCLSRRAVNVVTRIRQKKMHLALIGCSIGLPRVTFAYRKSFRSPRPRQGGLLEALSRGVEQLVAYSASPLRCLTYLGAAAALFNLLYVGYVVGVNLFKANVVEGWTTLSLQTSALFFFVFLILVLMAEYIGHILEEARDSPLYHVVEELGGSGPLLSDAARNVLGESQTLGNPGGEGGERRVA
jgi:polyisoprenyl-phosphate glycosyltransferase